MRHIYTDRCFSLKLTKELFTLHDTLVDGLVDTAANLNFVTVVSCTINQSGV